jgi:diphthine-ammonia ligase
MRLVGLVSGGKDSVFHLLECKRAGHTIVALANLCPAAGAEEELDSHCFQTVGHEAVESLAACMGLPLFRRETAGRATQHEVLYDAGRADASDEAEDLVALLRGVKSAVPEVEGVAAGAILSHYQRERVESAALRCSLSPVALLWMRAPEPLLRSMAASGMEAVFCKVSAMGLPASWLGASVFSKADELLDLAERYGIHPLGEGGEYESLVLRCPGLFFPDAFVELQDATPRIVSPSALAPTAFLSVPRARAVNAPPARVAFVRGASASGGGGESGVAGGGGGAAAGDGAGECWVSGAVEGGGEEVGSVEEDVEEVMKTLHKAMEEGGVSMDDVLAVRLLVPRMSEFARANSVYAKSIGALAPARSCVEGAALARAQLECTAVRGSGARGLRGEREKRFKMHVRSLSRWAPVAIAPYGRQWRSRRTRR